MELIWGIHLNVYRVDINDLSHDNIAY